MAEVWHLAPASPGFGIHGLQVFMKRSLIGFTLGTLLAVLLGSIETATAELQYFLHVRTHDGSSAGYNYTSDSYSFNPTVNYNYSNFRIAVTSKAAGTERFDLEFNGRNRWNSLMLTPGSYSAEYVDTGEIYSYWNAIGINVGARNCLSTERTFDDVTIHKFDFDSRYGDYSRIKGARIDFSKGCGTNRGQKARTFTIGSLYIYDPNTNTPAGQFQADISEITPTHTLARQFYSDRLPFQEFDVQVNKKPYDLHFDIRTASTPDSVDFERLITVTSLQNNQPVEVAEGASEYLEGITAAGTGLRVAAPYQYSCPAGSLISRVKVTNLTKGREVPDIFPDFYWLKSVRLEVTRHCADGTITTPGSTLGSRPPRLLSFAVVYLADVPESWVQLKYDLTTATNDNTSLKASIEQLIADYRNLANQLQGLQGARDAAEHRATFAEKKLSDKTAEATRFKQSVTTTATSAKTQLRSISSSYCGSRNACKQAVTRVIGLLTKIGG